MLVVKSEVLEKMRRSNQVRGRLVVAFDKHPNTINNWFDSNDPILTTATATKIISEELEIPESELLEEVTA